MPAVIPFSVPSNVHQATSAPVAKASAVDLPASVPQIGDAVDFEQVLAAQLSGPGKVPDNVLNPGAKGAPEAMPNKAKAGADKPEDQGVAAGYTAPVAPAALFALDSLQHPSQSVSGKDGAAPVPAERLAEVNTVSTMKQRLARVEGLERPGQAIAVTGDPTPPILALQANPEPAKLAGSPAATVTGGGPDTRAEQGLTGVQAQAAADPAWSAPLVPADSATGMQAQTAPLTPVTSEVAAPVGSRLFGEEVGQRLVWMASQRHQSAELRLNPPELGPVEVRLTLSSDQASLTILSSHAAVRDAVQSNLPRLHDMLQDIGVNLGSVFVGGHGSGQPFDQRSQSGAGGIGLAPVQTASEVVTPAGVATVGLNRTGFGIVDTFA